jgi:hypothetical protein
MTSLANEFLYPNLTFLQKKESLKLLLLTSDYSSGERENVFLSLLSKLREVNIPKFKEDKLQRINLQKKPISKTKFAHTSK